MDCVAHFGGIAVETLPSDKSDHLPILLSITEHNPIGKGRPRPYRVKAIWIHDLDGEHVIKDAWLGAFFKSLNWSYLSMNLFWCQSALTC